MLHAINLPLFGELAEPRAAVELAEAAEAAGFDGFYVWDHVLSPVAGSWDIADPWVVLSAIASRTSSLRIGTMVTPLPRRRIGKLARESVTLDRLSGGRLTLGLGAGGDGGRELSAFGDDPDARSRAETLDEGADLLVRLWAGEPVHHEGRITAIDVTMTPTPARGRIPIWIGCQGFRARTALRAARFDGVFPLDVADDDVKRLLDVVAEVRGTLENFDVALAVHARVNVDHVERLGATWAMHSFWPGHRIDQIHRFIERGVPG